ncbi:MAG: hypothetical protein ACYC2Y_10470 [Armatimonadota bacterium]
MRYLILVLLCALLCAPCLATIPPNRIGEYEIASCWQRVTLDCLWELAERPWSSERVIPELASSGNELILSELAADTEIHPFYRDSARLALGLKNDARQVPDLLRILRESECVEHRILAAYALHEFPTDEVRAALGEAARNDPTTATYAGEVYPVRMAAKEALESLEDPESSAWNQSDFAAKLAEYETGKRAEVPLRAYIDLLGWEVLSFDPATKTAVVSDGKMRATLTATRIVKGSAMVSHRDVARLVYRSVLLPAESGQNPLPAVY